jgi:putative sigma-54 modulation protein
MNIEYVGINVSITKAMREKTDRTMSKLLRYLHDTDTVKITFSVEGTEQKVSGIIFLPEHKTVRVEAASENMYQSIDLLQEKLIRQLRRIQTKKIDEKQKNTEGKDQENINIEYEDQDQFVFPFC